MWYLISVRKFSQSHREHTVCREEEEEESLGCIFKHRERRKGGGKLGDDEGAFWELGRPYQEVLSSPEVKVILLVPVL